MCGGGLRERFKVYVIDDVDTEVYERKVVNRPRLAIHVRRSQTGGHVPGE